MTKPYTKYQVQYEPKANDQKEHCSICEHYEGNNSCELVQGYIKPLGWCSKFKKKGK